MKRLPALILILFCILFSGCGYEASSPAPEPSLPISEPLREAVVEDITGNIPELSALYDRASELSHRYGVCIYIADTLPEDLSAEQYTDPELIGLCLDALDECFGSYPTDFFRHFPYGEYDRIHIYLTGSIILDGNSGGAAGTYWPGENALCIQIDADCLTSDKAYFDYIFNHELGHMIDYRMHYESADHAPSIDDETWSSLNPEGFEYAGNSAEDQMALYDTCFEYFVDSYGTCSADEDRAELFGSAMAACLDRGYVLSAFDQAHCREKFDYLCRCIRTEFSYIDASFVLPWESAVTVSPGT